MSPTAVSPRAIGPLGTGLLRAYAWTFIGLFGAGVLLGLDWRGWLLDGGRAHPPLVPGTAVLLAPAGALLVLAFAVRLAGVWPYTSGGRRYLRVSVAGIAAGLALIGVGILAVDHATLWRALTLPGLLLAGGWILATVVSPARRRAFLARARSHGGRLWMACAGVGIVIVLAVIPVGVAWSLGLITIR